jgi:hypothetical protein
LSISSDNEIYHLNPNAQLYITQETLSGEEAFQKITQQKLHPVKAKVNQGMNKENSYWLLFEIENGLEESEVFLEIDYAQLDYTQLFEIQNEDSVVFLFETGDRFAFNQRPIQYRNFVFPLLIPTLESRKFLLNLDKRASAMRFPINVYSEKFFSQKESSENVFYLIYFGFTTLIILFSLAVGIRLRKAIFLWYALHVLMVSMWAFTVLGFAYHYIIPSYPKLNTHILPIITSLFNLCFLFYVRSFFDTKRSLPKFHKVMDGIIGICVLLFILWASLPQIILTYAPNFLILKYSITTIIVIFSYTAAIKHLKTNRFISRIFILAYTFLFVGTFIKILSGYGIVDESTFILDPLILGFIAEVFILSIAMVSILLKMIEDREKLKMNSEKMIFQLSKEIERNKSEIIELKSGAILHVDDIVLVEADGHYLKFHLIKRSNPEVDRNQIKSIISSLPSKFVKVHRSYVVNVDHIKIKQATKIFLKDGSEIPVSRTFKSTLDKAMNLIK